MHKYVDLPPIVSCQQGSTLTDAVLPSAGRATRMRGLPKFLLPSGPDNLTLLERHIGELLHICDTIWIPTRPEQTILLESLGISSDRVIVVPMDTQTMTETVLRVTGISGAQKFILVMPDTYFAGEKPYSYLADATAPLSIAAWQIRQEQKGKLGQILLSETYPRLVLNAEDKNRDCDFPHAWGAMSFSREVLSHFSIDMPHTGYAIPKLLKLGFQVEARIIEGSYFDCGTPAEYIAMLKSEFN